jgi:predicted AAA+ superfamily ATPase
MLGRPVWEELVEARLAQFPAVALVGSRQVGKTSLARRLVDQRGAAAVYLDLEMDESRRKLAEPAPYLRSLADRLVVLDEIQHVPELFATLRGLIDERREPGRFLILGSAAPSMLRQSSESLAGRIAYVELPPFGVTEVGEDDAAVERLWVRGGYPDSFLAASDAASLVWREQFVRAYLQRDLPQLGVSVPTATMERFWTMLSHWQGQTWNGSKIAASLGVTGPTARRYLDAMTDACLVRQLQPCFPNVKKRLVKSPKVYVRDSGVLHLLQRVPDRAALFGHPMAGASFEGFVVEQTLALLPWRVEGPTFYASHGGATIDLVLGAATGERVGVEIKLSSAPKITRGFREAMADVECARGYVVVPSGTRYPAEDRIEVISVAEFLREVVLPMREPGATGR